MKRKIFTVLIVLLLAITSSISVQARGEVTATLRASNSKVKPGETFTVTLSAICDEVVGVIETDFTYNKDILELQNTEIVAPNTMCLKQIEGIKDGISLIPSANTIIRGDITKLTFKVKEDATMGQIANVGTTEIEITDEQSIDYTIEPKSVTIEVADETTGEGDSSTGEGTIVTPPEDNNQEQNPPKDDLPEDDKSEDNKPEDNKKEENKKEESKPATTPKKDTTTTKDSNLPKTGRSTTLTIMLIIEAMIVLMFVGLFFGYKSFVKKKYRQ